MEVLERSPRTHQATGVPPRPHLDAYRARGPGGAPGEDAVEGAAGRVVQLAPPPAVGPDGAERLAAAAPRKLHLERQVHERPGALDGDDEATRARTRRSQGDLVHPVDGDVVDVGVARSPDERHAVEGRSDAPVDLEVGPHPRDPGAEPAAVHPPKLSQRASRPDTSRGPPGRVARSHRHDPSELVVTHLRQVDRAGRPAYSHAVPLGLARAKATCAREPPRTPHRRDRCPQRHAGDAAALNDQAGGRRCGRLDARRRRERDHRDCHGQEEAPPSHEPILASSRSPRQGDGPARRTWS